MLQINFIRQNPELVKERLAVKNFADLQAIERILAKDEELRKLKTSSENLQASINSASKEIGALMAKGDKEAAEARKQEVALHKASQQSLQQQLADTEKDLQDELIKLPNLPHTSVPKGNSPADNEVVRQGGKMPQLHEGAVPHWDLIKKYDIIDFETGVKLTGSGFPVYKGKGAKLQRSLIQYFLDYNTAAGYTEYLPPHMVNEASAYGTGQLPDKEAQMYTCERDNLYRYNLAYLRFQQQDYARAAAMIVPGIFLSQPGSGTLASYHCARITVSIESAIMSRDSSEHFMPSVPIEMPSLTPMV